MAPNQPAPKGAFKTIGINMQTVKLESMQYAVNVINSHPESTQAPFAEINEDGRRELKKELIEIGIQFNLLDEVIRKIEFDFNSDWGLHFEAREAQFGRRITITLKEEWFDFFMDTNVFFEEVCNAKY